LYTLQLITQVHKFSLNHQQSNHYTENHCCHDDVFVHVHSDGAVARVLTSLIVLSSSWTSSVKMAEAREHTATSYSADAAAAATEEAATAGLMSNF